MRSKKLLSRQQGFTVIELLIATAVFGMVLMVVTIGIMQLSRVYYKGNTERNTQNAARTIVDMIAQGIQFNGGTVTTTPASPTAGSSYAFCVGNQQYSYTIGYQVTGTYVAATHQTPHGLVVRDLPGCTSSSPAQNVTNTSVVGRELIPKNMRLTNLEVSSPRPNMYKISVRIVNGADDILTVPVTSATTQCQAVKAGTQFCAISDLTTVVTKRVK